MIQTATLLPALPPGLRAMTTVQTGDATGHFADSFAQASDTAAPEILAVSMAGDRARQDGAATGNGLPILALADDPASPWDPAITPRPAGRPVAMTMAAPADVTSLIPIDTAALPTAIDHDAPAEETDQAPKITLDPLPIIAVPRSTDSSEDVVAQTSLASGATKTGSPTSKVADLAAPVPRSRPGRRSQPEPIAASKSQSAPAADPLVDGDVVGLKAPPTEEAIALSAPVTSAAVTSLPGLVAAEPVSSAAPAPRTRSRVGMNAVSTSPSERTPAANSFDATPSVKRPTGAESMAATPVQPLPDAGVPRPASLDPIASGPVTSDLVLTTPRRVGEAVARARPIASLSVGERGSEIASSAQSRGSPSAILGPRGPVAPERTLADALVSSQPQPVLLNAQRDPLSAGTAAPPASPIAGPNAPTVDEAPATTRLQAPHQSTAQPAEFTPRQSFTASPMQSSTRTAPDMIAPLMGAPVPPSVPAIVAMPSIVANGSIADRTAAATGAPEIRPAETPAIGSPRWTATDATTPVALAVARPDALQPQSGTVASAAQVFGAAIQAATKLRDEAKTTPGSADAALSSTPLAAFHEVRTTDAQQAPVDVRQERWPQAMIERIETLRDAADATDTRIRLIPDALGAIDVSVKREGDTVHVHFNAEQAATRTLLQDAQPRLVELAEARGLKLGQASLGDGSAGGNAGSSQQRAPVTPQTPNRTAPAAAVTADATDDTRIA